MCVRTCVYVSSCVCACSLASQPYFPRMRMLMRKLAEGVKEKYVWAGFCGSVVFAELLPRVHNDYKLMSSLETISPSRSSMR